MPAPFDFKSALTVPLAKFSAAFAYAFEGYFMPVADDPQAFASRVRTEQHGAARSRSTWPRLSWCTLGRRWRAWGLVVVQPETVVVQAVIVPLDARRQGEGTRFLQVLAHQFPGRQLMVPAVVPEALADGFMLGNGSQHGERSQWEMGCSLA